MSEALYPGIKEFCRYWGHPPMLQQTYEAFVNEFAADNDGCIDAAKSMVECVCKTLVQEIDDPKNPIKDWADSPIKNEKGNWANWVTAAVRLLKLSDRRDDALNKIISQHYKLAQSLGDFRNVAGTISHGREGFMERLTSHHRRAAVLAAESIVLFLHESYLNIGPDPTSLHEPFIRFERENKLIDRFCGLKGAPDEEGNLSITLVLPDSNEIPLNISPAELLFGVDRTAYKEVLLSCREFSEKEIMSE